MSVLVPIQHSHKDFSERNLAKKESDIQIRKKSNYFCSLSYTVLTRISQAWWHILLKPALGKWWQEIKSSRSLGAGEDGSAGKVLVSQVKGPGF